MQYHANANPDTDYLLHNKNSISTSRQIVKPAKKYIFTHYVDVFILQFSYFITAASLFWIGCLIFSMTPILLRMHFSQTAFHHSGVKFTCMLMTRQQQKA